MNKQDYDKYYQQGGSYVIPVEIFNELFEDYECFKNDCKKHKEVIDKTIKCHQHGEWGTLNSEQRNLIKRLLDELDRADNCFKRVYLENIKQKEVIDKAIELRNNFAKENAGLIFENNEFIKFMNNLLDILKEVSE